MKHVQIVAAALLAIAVVGCGGSGNGTPAAKISGATPRVEAIVQVLRTNLQHPDLWTDAQLLNPQTPGLQADLVNPNVFGIEDPTNIQCNEQVVFQLVNYGADGTRNIIPATFVSSDSAGLFGNLSPATGVYLAGASPSSGSPAMSAVADGQTYTTFFSIKVDQVKITGTVLAQGTNANQLAGSILEFFNSTGGLVDTVTIASDGTFRGSIPTVATSFTIVADTLPATFYQSFNYLGLQYTAGVTSCFAPLPTGLSAGITPLSGVIYVTPRVDGVGSPTPTGCADPAANPRNIVKK